MLQVRNGRVKGEVSLEEETVGLSLLGDQREAVLHGLLRRVEVHELSAVIDAARSAGAYAENGLEELRSARTDQAVETEDLALADIKAHVLNVRLELGREVLNREYVLARRIVDRRETILERASDHGCDQLV